MVFFLELYQLFLLVFRNLFRWITLSLEFVLKVIFRIWMFIIDCKHFILDGYWWKIYQFIMLFLLELYQFFFLFFKIWSDGEVLAWNFLRAITLSWMCSDDNMFDLSFRSSLICYKLSSCLLKISSAFSRDTSSSLASKSIIILCCLSG